MAEKRLKRPRDPVQLANLIGDIATGQVEDKTEDRRNRATAELRSKGGKARAATMSARRRKEIAKKAAASRWSQKKS
jgi:hypothetical protein